MPLLFLSFIVPIFSRSVQLISLIFLKRSLVFPILMFSSISLHCSFKKAFLCLLAILWNSLAFSMIQRMLAIWFLVLLLFLNLSWTSESSWFTYCWSLAWRILSITLLACELSAIVRLCGMDLTEAEDTKKRWPEYTELYWKGLHDPDIHDGMITHLEPDILEYKVKWALVSITANKASWGEGIPAELFQILKVDAVKVLHSCQQIWKTQQWPQDWTRSDFFPISKAMLKNFQTTAQLHSSHMLAKWKWSHSVVSDSLWPHRQ